MKTKVTLSVDIEVLEEFKELADKKGVNLSKFFNGKMKEFIEEVKHEKSK